MKPDIDKMLSCTYEIEGLLLVAQRVSNDIPQVICDKIKLKMHELTAMADNLTQGQQTNTAIQEPQVEVSEPPTPIVQDEAPVTSGHLPEEDYDADETWQHDNGEEFKEVFALEYEEPTHQPITSSPNEDTSEREQTIIAAPQTIVEIEEQHVPASTNDPMRVDEKLQRTLSKNLRQAFSINDRYRFSRELFGNNSDAMNKALDRIEQMNHYDEAEDYCYNHLGWQNDNDVVVEFMQILNNHFH